MNRAIPLWGGAAMRCLLWLIVGVVSIASLDLPAAVQTKPGDKVYRVGTLFPPVVQKSFRMEEIRKAWPSPGTPKGASRVEMSPAKAV